MYGIALGVGAVGGLLGAVSAARVTEVLGSQRVLLLAHLPMAAAAITAAASTEVWMVSAAFGLSNLALLIYKVPSQALRQRVVPDRLLGRVVTAFRVFGLGGPIIGAPVGGMIADAFGVRWSFGVSAAVLVPAWLLMLMSVRALPGRVGVACQREGPKA